MMQFGCDKTEINSERIQFCVSLALYIANYVTATCCRFKHVQNMTQKWQSIHYWYYYMTPMPLPNHIWEKKRINI